jgi:ubiquinone/menaquinone biosynthesis C-methylase UbiE
VILDVGCGRGAGDEDNVNYRKNIRVLKGKSKKVIGIDVDKNGQYNQGLDEFHHIESQYWPIEDNSINLLVCDNVLEHIPNPDQFFKEINRVLKDGGYVCIRTPNRWSYIALAASLIPNKWHTKVTSFVQDGRADEDVFPTVYKCNSTRKLKKIMSHNGIDCVVYNYEATPSYLSFSKIAYFFGVLHQRFAPGFMKPAIFAFGKITK